MDAIATVSCVGNYVLMNAADQTAFTCSDQEQWDGATTLPVLPQCVESKDMLFLKNTFLNNQLYFVQRVLM